MEIGKLIMITIDIEYKLKGKIISIILKTIIF